MNLHIAKAFEMRRTFDQLVEDACAVVLSSGALLRDLRLEHTTGPSPRTYLVVRGVRVFEAWVDFDLQGPAVNIRGRWLVVLVSGGTPDTPHP